MSLPSGGKSRRTVIRALAAVAGIVVLTWAWRGTNFDLERLIRGLPRMGEFFQRMVPPDMGVARTVVVSTAESIQIALFGTALSAVVSFAFGLLGASNLTPKWVHQPIKWAFSVLRAIPLLLLALIFVSTVGLGPFPGVLAIAVHSVGMLGKFYSEAFEAARMEPIEALDSAGAFWSQKVRFGIIPQVLPQLARDTLFRFELNIRESLILGLVGAGGIGFYIQLYARAFQYEKVATLTVVVLVMVVTLEQASAALQRKLR